jgi:hypothetical protein
MKMKPIGEPRVCPACNAQLTGPTLRDCSCSPSGKKCGFGTDETKRTAEQVRFLLCWDAVLREAGITKVGCPSW